MRAYLEDLFKNYFHAHLVKSCASMKLSKTAAAKLLQMTYRSYSALENRENSCRGLTLALYLIYMSENPLAFLCDFAAKLNLPISSSFDATTVASNMALSYRLPMSVKEIKRDAHGNRHAICPRCGMHLDHTDKRYCDQCGQRLDWNSFPGPIINNPV